MAEDVPGCIAGQGFEAPAITLGDAVRAGWLPGPRRGPVGRMLIAQAQARDLARVSNETLFDGCGRRRIW